MAKKRPLSGILCGEIWSILLDCLQQNYADAIGRNKNDIKTYLADQQNLLVGFGMTREAGAELAEQMTSLALDLASFGNMDETVSVNAMTKAVMGESEAAKTLGAVLNDVTRAQAIQDIGLSGTYESLDQLTKMQVNYQAILSQSPDAIGDCERSLDSYASTVKSFEAKLKEVKTLVGQFFLSTFQKAMKFGANGVTMLRNGIKWLTDFANKVGGAERILGLLGFAIGATILAMNVSKITVTMDTQTYGGRAKGEVYTFLKDRWPEIQERKHFYETEPLTWSNAGRFEDMPDDEWYRWKYEKKIEDFSDEEIAAEFNRRLKSIPFHSLDVEVKAVVTGRR